MVVLNAVASEGSDLLADMAVEVTKATVFLVILVPVGGKVLPPLFGQIRQIRQISPSAPP